jgi:death-on-curing protein
MISLDDLLKIHNASIAAFGGSYGIRDIGLLESAIARPFQTFGGEDLYPGAIDKAAALCESLILNHPFVDGNKRTGFASMVALLLEYGLSLTATNQAAYEAMIQVSTGAMDFDDLKHWLIENTSVPMEE